MDKVVNALAWLKANWKPLAVGVVLGVIAGSVSAKEVASSTDGTQLVRLYDDACTAKGALAQIEAEREQIESTFGEIPPISKAEYQENKDADVVHGCWFLHPTGAPMVVMVWDGRGVGVVPAYLFESPSK